VVRKARLRFTVAPRSRMRSKRSPSGDGQHDQRPVMNGEIAAQPSDLWRDGLRADDGSIVCRSNRTGEPPLSPKVSKETFRTRLIAAKHIIEATPRPALEDGPLQNSIEDQYAAVVTSRKDWKLQSLLPMRSRQGGALGRAWRPRLSASHHGSAI
jgi:hypothetical protein